MNTLSPPPGLDPDVVSAALTAESAHVLTAFAFAVIDTHPDPQALAKALEANLDYADDAVRQVPGSDGPALQYASIMGKQLALAMVKRALRR